MIDLLRETSQRLIESVPIGKHRFLFDRFEMNERLTGVFGPRGVGKTTLLLQYLRDKHGLPGEAFYASADHIFFNRCSLLEFVREVHMREETRYFVFDEVHKYPNWSRELKLMYDDFLDLNVIFTSSSILDIYKGESDLSRRAVAYNLAELSFREYLLFYEKIELPVLTLQEILNNHNRNHNQNKFF
jgi:predicted AAA+ superfamily ATPase